MEDNKYDPKYCYIDEIYLKEIIFEKSASSTDVTIFGYYDNPYEEDLVRVDYWCQFSTLTDLLIAANENGEPIITAITEKLNDTDPEYPTVIDVENMFGKPLKIEDIVLTIYRPMEQDENGEWKEEEWEAFYILESVEPKEAFEQKKASKTNLKSQLDEHLILLDNAYKYYLQLLDLDISKKSARKKAGLKDELLFRMAVINHQIINF